MFFGNLNSRGNLIPNKTGSKFLQGKITISDKNLTDLVKKISRCCGLCTNIEEFEKYSANISKVLEQLYTKGVEIINSKIYLHKKRGRYVLNYYNRTHQLRKSFKLKIKAKVIDVENGMFSFAAFFYFDTKEWKNYYLKGKMGKNYLFQNDNDNDNDGKWAKSIYTKTTMINGKRVKQTNRKGGGKMFRPHANTWGSQQKIGLQLIDWLDQGFHIGDKWVAGRHFVADLNKLSNVASSFVSADGTTVRSMYKRLNLPISPVVRSGRWTKKAQQAMKIGDETTLLSICRQMDRELMAWADNALELDESLFKK